MQTACALPLSVSFPGTLHTASGAQLAWHACLWVQWVPGPSLTHVALLCPVLRRSPRLTVTSHPPRPLSAHSASSVGSLLTPREHLLGDSRGHCLLGDKSLGGRSNSGRMLSPREKHNKNSGIFDIQHFVVLLLHLFTCTYMYVHLQ